MARREKRPFLVEVRRGGKKPAGKSDTPKPTVEWPALPEESIAPEHVPVVRMAAPEIAKSMPAGRILPSLIEVPPAALIEEEEPEAPRRRGRPPGSLNKTARLPSPANDTGPRRRGRPPKPRKAPQPFTWPDEPDDVEIAIAPLAIVAAPVEAAPRQPRQRRVSRILGRYVYGTMAKRGERWKRQFR